MTADWRRKSAAREVEFKAGVLIYEQFGEISSALIRIIGATVVGVDALSFVCFCRSILGVSSLLLGSLRGNHAHTR